MIELPGVTLCCIDTANHRLALRALARSRTGVAFGRTLFLTAALPPEVAVPDGIDVIPIEPIVSRDQYSQFVLKSLLEHAATSHVLLVQWDGYVVHPESWDPEFADWDYIGAQWFWYDDGMRVGNGGFSLRSRRLLEALQDPRIVLAGGEDDTICRTFRPLLEREHGIRFAPEAMADRFAFEAAYPIGKPFGFHGLFNFYQVVPQDELAALANLFSDPIAASPQLDQLLRNCVATGQWTAAIAIGRRILAAQPANADARALLAQAEQAAARGPVAGRNDPCPCGSGRRYKHCHGAVGGSPPGSPTAPASAAAPPPAAGADALVAGAMQVHQRGDLDAAERGYRAALAGDPRHPHALHFLGVVLYQRGRIDEALPLLEQAVALIPHEPEFHNNLGLALLASDRVADAIAAHREALRLAPGNSSAGNNLGLALQEANDLPGAVAAFREALARQPDFARAHWNLGLALLAHGDFVEGWREYDWRLGIDELTRGRQLPFSTRWDGRDPAGRTILLTAEQGLGDALQFVRFARPLAARGARVLVETAPALARLLATAPGVAATCLTGAPIPPYDAHLPLLSLAGILGVAADTIPNDVPYVTPDAQDAAAIAVELEPHRRNLLVGLSWAGNPRYSADRRRSCPLAALAPLLEMQGVTFFSLQRDDGEDQLPGVPAARNIVLLEARRDFDRKAALVDALDLVISVDTSHAHLAGALARPVWVLLPFSPDWRWQLDRGDSPWYPTARLFRQRQHGQWAAPIDDIRRALAALIADRR